MSGGHWGYRSGELERQGEHLQYTFNVLAILEHAIDWGICCDTCSACDRINAYDALVAYFDNETVNDIRAIMRRDSCERCKKWAEESSKK